MPSTGGINDNQHRTAAIETALGGAAVAWPLAARAQQPAMPVVGFLRSTSLAPFENLVLAFGEGLKQAGFVDGQNVKIEYRYAENQRDRLPALVADLAHLPVAVLVVNSGAAAAAKAATTTIPIVFAAGADPVKDGQLLDGFEERSASTKT